jgi:hypothetical protein
MRPCEEIFEMGGLPFFFRIERIMFKKGTLEHTGLGQKGINAFPFLPTGVILQGLFFFKMGKPQPLHQNHAYCPFLLIFQGLSMVGKRGKKHI